MSEYIEFVEIHDTGKTKIFDVRSLNDGAMLGVIRWYGAWRQYVFMPERVTVWNTTCLKTIITFINGLMKERQKKTCPSGVHIYTTKEDKSLMECERCGKPYSELDAR